MIADLYKISSGGIWPMDIPVAQSWLEIGAILHTIHKCNINTFVEIGAHRGGLAAIINARFKMTGGYYVGYEIDPEIIDDRARQFNIVVDDVFRHIIVGEIYNTINNSPSPCFVYCDGGDKVREFRTFKDYIRDVDIIAMHDWGCEYPEFVAPKGFTRTGLDYLDGTTIAMFRRV